MKLNRRQIKCEAMKKILGILQNQWFREPEKVKAMYEQYPQKRNYFIKTFLFMGCLTGKRLSEALGDNLCHQIIWEEASPEVGGFSSSLFPADVGHLKSSIELHKPEVICCFGKIAGDGLRQLGLTLPVYYAPHPASRRDPMPQLRQLSKRLREEQGIDL